MNYDEALSLLQERRAMTKTALAKKHSITRVTLDRWLIKADTIVTDQIREDKELKAALSTYGRVWVELPISGTTSEEIFDALMDMDMPDFRTCGESVLFVSAKDAKRVYESVWYQNIKEAR